MTLSMANLEAITCCDAIVDSCDTGASAALLRIYDGTPPARVDAALSGNTLLAELTMSDPSFGAAADDPGNNAAKATANSITQDSSANATGTASFYRIYDGQATRVPRIQGSVSTSGAELNFNTVSFVVGAIVRVTALTVSVPEG